MAIFVLTRTDKIDYGEYDGMVIRAPNEKKARAMANLECADEGMIWTSSLKVDCVRYKTSGFNDVVMKSYRAG